MTFWPPVATLTTKEKTNKNTVRKNFRISVHQPSTTRNDDDDSISRQVTGWQCPVAAACTLQHTGNDSSDDEWNEKYHQVFYSKMRKEVGVAVSDLYGDDTAQWCTGSWPVEESTQEIHTHTHTHTHFCLRGWTKGERKETTTRVVLLLRLSLSFFFRKMPFYLTVWSFFFPFSRRAATKWPSKLNKRAGLFFFSFLFFFSVLS